MLYNAVQIGFSVEEFMKMNPRFYFVMMQRHVIQNQSHKNKKVPHYQYVDELIESGDW